MLTHERIKKASELQVQVETNLYGTLLGVIIGTGNSCSYEDNNGNSYQTQRENKLEQETQE